MTPSDQDRHTASAQDEAAFSGNFETITPSNIREDLAVLDRKLLAMRSSLRRSPRATDAPGNRPLFFEEVASLAGHDMQAMNVLVQRVFQEIQESKYPTPDCLLADEVADCVKRAYIPDERFSHVLECSWCTTLLTTSFSGGGPSEGTLLGTNLDDLLLEALMAGRDQESRETMNIKTRSRLRKRLIQWLSG